MILIIIFAVLLVVGITALIVIHNSDADYFYDHEWPFGVTMFCAIAGGFFLFLFGLIAIGSNCESTVQDHLIHYEEEVEELQSSRSYILNITDDHVRSIAITEYNEKVGKFKHDIRSHQYFLTNPWINWLTSRSYRSMDADIVDYLRSP